MLGGLQGCVCLYHCILWRVILRFLPFRSYNRWDWGMYAHWPEKVCTSSEEGHLVCRHPSSFCHRPFWAEEWMRRHWDQLQLPAPWLFAWPVSWAQWPARQLHLDDTNVEGDVAVLKENTKLEWLFWAQLGFQAIWRICRMFQVCGTSTYPKQRSLEILGNWQMRSWDTSTCPAPKSPEHWYTGRRFRTCSCQGPKFRFLVLPSWRTFGPGMLKATGFAHFRHWNLSMSVEHLCLPQWRSCSGLSWDAGIARYQSCRVQLDRSHSFETWGWFTGLVSWPYSMAIEPSLASVWFGIQQRDQSGSAASEVSGCDFSREPFPSNSKQVSWRRLFPTRWHWTCRMSGCQQEWH